MSPLQGTIRCSEVSRSEGSSIGSKGGLMKGNSSSISPQLSHHSQRGPSRLLVQISLYFCFETRILKTKMPLAGPPKKKHSCCCRLQGFLFKMFQKFFWVFLKTKNQGTTQWNVQIDAHGSFTSLIFLTSSGPIRGAATIRMGIASWGTVVQAIYLYVL